MTNRGKPYPGAAILVLILALSFFCSCAARETSQRQKPKCAAAGGEAAPAGASGPCAAAGRRERAFPSLPMACLFLSRSDIWSAPARRRFLAARLDGPPHGVSSHAAEKRRQAAALQITCTNQYHVEIEAVVRSAG